MKDWLIDQAMTRKDGPIARFLIHVTCRGRADECVWCKVSPWRKPVDG